LPSSNVERRHHIRKAHQAVAPVYLDPARIEAFLCCDFLALPTGALIERQARSAMADHATTALPRYRRWLPSARRQRRGTHRGAHRRHNQRVDEDDEK
jgi:hypothetical protein